MANENDKDVLDEQIDAPDDATDWKSRAEQLENKITRARDSRKSQKDKYESEITGLKAQLELTRKPDEKPSDKLLEKVNSALLRAYGYTDPEEVALLHKWEKDTGKDIEELHAHPALSKVIKAEIEDLRTAKANTAATRDIQGKSMQGDKSKPDYWIGKGEMPPNTPENRKLNAAIIREAARRESGGGSEFYNG